MPSDLPIASRQFRNRDGAVSLEIYAPQQVSPSESSCRIVIRWPDGKIKDRCFSGVDSMQALLMAISLARVMLRYPKVAKRDDSIRFLDNGDLGMDLLPSADEADS